MPTEYENVPFHVKALKILLHELQNSVEADRPKQEEAESDDGVRICVGMGETYEVSNSLS